MSPVVFVIELLPGTIMQRLVRLHENPSIFREVFFWSTVFDRESFYWDVAMISQNRPTFRQRQVPGEYKVSESSCEVLQVLVVWVKPPKDTLEVFIIYHRVPLSDVVSVGIAFNVLV